jgi:DNA repair protein RecO (recombination protein O)
MSEQVVSSRPRTYSIEAVVVRASDFGEADRLITLLTPFRGLVRAVARGARKQKSRLGGNVDLLRYIKVSVSEGRSSLHSVSQAESLSTLRGLHSGLEKMSTGLYLAEIAERFSVEGGSNPALFNQLVHMLQVLDAEPLHPLMARWFEVQVLRINGFLPEIGACVDCGDALEPANHVFSPVRGGLVCPDCRASESDVLLSASLNTIKLMRHMVRAQWDAVRPLECTEDALRQVARVMREHMHYVLDRNVRSSAFMDEVTRWRSNP